MGLLDRALNIGEGKQFREYEKRVSRDRGLRARARARVDDDELRERIDALREEVAVAARARSTTSSTESFAIVREAGRRTMGMRHFDVQLDRRHGAARRQHRRDEDRRGQDADRHARRLPQRARRQGRPRRHGQRLPRPPRRRVDEPDLRPARLHLGRAAEHAGGRGQDRRPTPPTSPTARTPSSASTTCATTWRSRSRRRSSTAGASARTAGRWRCTTSRSSTRSTTSSSTRRARR